MSAREWAALSIDGNTVIVERPNVEVAIVADPSDATLIAAAPDLLRVVDGLLQVCHRGPDESKGGANQESYADWKQRMISEAIDAIAKARGSR